MQDALTRIHRAIWHGGNIINKDSIPRCMLLARARELLAIGEYHAAIKEINIIERSAEGTADQHAVLDCHLMKAKAFVRLGNYSAAMESAERATDLSRTLRKLNIEIKSSLLLARSLGGLHRTQECHRLLDRCRTLLDEQNDTSISESSDLEALLWETRGMAHMNEDQFEKAANCLSQSQRLFEQTENRLGAVRSRILKEQIRISTGEHLDTALVNLQEALTEAENIGDNLEISNAIAQIAAVFAHRGATDYCLELYQKGLALREHLGSRQGIAKMLVSISAYHTRRGAYSEALAYSRRVLDHVESLENSPEEASAYNIMGVVHQRHSHLELSLQYFDKARVMEETLAVPTRMSWVLNNFGVTYQHLGELNKAKDYYERSLEIKVQIGAVREISSAYNNLGEVLALQGEFEAALAHFHESLALTEQDIAESESAARTQKNIGEIHRSQGEFNEALEWYENSLKNRRRLGNDIFTCETLFALVVLCAENGEMDTAKIHLNALHEMDERTSETNITQHHDLAEAVILKSSKRHASKFRALSKFRRVSEDVVTDHHLTVFALLNLFDLLLFELRSSGNEEVLEDAEQISDRLHQIAKDQHSHSLLVETFLLKSRLALVQVDLTEAKRLLDQAELTAKEKELPKLALKISNQQDALLNQSSMLAKLTKTNAPLTERLDLAQIEQIVKSMLTKSDDQVVAIPEEPALLLIVDSFSGICIHSKSFEDEDFNTDLNIGGFLSAIDAFIREAFSTTGSIERIKHAQYTLVTKERHSLRFWYAFKGQSYSALNKLNSFLDVSEQVPALWNKKKGSAPKLTNEDSEALDSIADRIFTEIKTNV